MSPEQRRGPIVNRIETGLPGVCILEPEVHRDERGHFLETYNRRSAEAIGIVCEFVQDNESCSRKGVLRGLH
jgi:dTDP-4-dehydrorhamnose 3,5-epimerase